MVINSINLVSRHFSVSLKIILKTIPNPNPFCYGQSLMLVLEDTKLHDYPNYSMKIAAKN